MTTGRSRPPSPRDRAKTRNVRRDPGVALSVLGDDWSQDVVAEGSARIVEDPLLRHVYRGVTGTEHLDWEEFDEAMIRDGRVVLAITIERLYPLEG
jgi:hypothetical protein